MKRALFAAAVLAVAAGCAQQDDVRAPSGGYRDELSAKQYPEVVFQDGLDQDLVIHEAPAVRPATASMPMMVRLTLRSVSDQDVNAKVRFVFYAADGSSVTDNPVWQPYAIPPRSRQYIEGNSVVLNAVRWEAQVARE